MSIYRDQTFNSDKNTYGKNTSRFIVWEITVRHTKEPQKKKTKNIRLF